MAKKTRFTGFDKTLSPYFKTVPNEKVPWRLQSVDGKYFGDVSWEAYKAVEEFNLDSYKPKNEKEKSILDNFKKHKGFSLQTENGIDFGKVSYEAYVALSKGNIDGYTPKDNEEKKVIDDFKDTIGYGKTVFDVKSQYNKDKFGKGNIDLTQRPIYTNADGTISTVSSMSIGVDGKEVLIPTIVWDENGKPKKLTEDEAIEHYYKTGQHLGIFDSVSDANKYANKLHVEQELYYDFVNNSQYKSTKNGKKEKKMYGANGVRYIDTGYDDIEHDYINGDKRATEIVTLNESYDGDYFYGYDSEFLKEMTDDQKAIYNYIYNKYGKEAGKEYIKTISSELYATQRSNKEQEMSDYAKEHKFKSSAATVLLSPLKVYSLAGQVGDYLDDGKIDQNAGYNKFVYNTNAVRSTVADEISKGWSGDVGAFLYNTGMSIGDSAMNTVVSGGTKYLSLGMMGAGAWADTVVSSKDKGLSDNQAMGLGLIAGGAEVITEAFSFDALFGAKNAGKTFGKGATQTSAKKYLLDNIKTNALEEMSADLINFGADVIIAKDKSQWQESINKYVKAGHSKSKAWALAFRDTAGQIALSGVAGGLSGATMSGPGALFVNSQIKKVGQANSNNVLGIIGEGLNYDKNSEAYKNALKLANSKGEITDADLGTQVLLNDAQKINNTINEGLKQDKNSEAYKNALKLKKSKVEITQADLEYQEMLNNSKATVSIGDTFTDSKYNITIKVVGRDANSTTIETTNLTTGAVETKSLPHSLVNSMLTNDRYSKIETSATTDVSETVPTESIEVAETVTEPTTTDSSIPTSTDTVSVGDTFIDKSTGVAIKVIGRDEANTTVQIATEDGFTVKPMTNAEFDNVVARGQLERVTTEESTPSVADTSEVTAKAEEPIRDINLKRVGRYYEAYGEEAKLLAAELDIETTKAVINGVETDMLRLPADLTEKLASTNGSEFNLVLSDKPTSTEVENATVTDETTTSDETIPDDEESATEVEATIKGETDNSAEVLKNESTSDTIESKSETTPVESEDNGNERSKRTVEERTVHNDGNVERTDGERTGRSSERVSGKTGNAQKTETERTIRKKVATATFDEVKRDYYTPKMESLEKGTYDKYGVVVKYFYGKCIDDSGAKGNAFYYKGVLYIRADDETSLESRIDHEITHHFGKSNAMTKFRNAVKAKMPKAEYDSWYAEIKEAYGDVLMRYLSEELKNSNYTLTDAELQQLMDEYIEEEMLANLNGEQVPFATEYREEIEAFRKEIGNYNTKNTKSKATSESKTKNNPAEYSESIDAGGETRYSLFPGGVFPPYNKSHSDANERATRWAHNDDIETGAQRIFFYKGAPYLVEKFDSMELGYLVMRKLTKKSLARYERNMIEYEERDKDGRNNGPQSGRKDSVSDNERHQGLRESRGRSFNDNNNSDRYNGEAAGIQRVDREQNGERSAQDHGSRDNKHSVEDREKVSHSLKDSTGRELSKGQQEYFKDSKVRDENGNLKVVYHGTRKADFTEFKRNINFFTDSEEMADSYSPNSEMYKGYLNITKPYEIDAAGEKWSKVPVDEATKEFLQEYGASVFKEGGKWRTTPADIAAAIEEAVDNGELDYDGIIIKNIDDTGSYYKGKEKNIATDYITFNSNQFKNDDNTKPTSNPDIRYSVAKEDNLETQKKIESIAKEINTHDELIEIAKKNTQEFVDKIKENQSLQKRLDNAKRQTSLSPKPIINIPKVGKVTKDILKEMDSTLKATDLKDEIISIYTEYFDNMKKASGVESKVQEANDNMMKRFANLAIDIAESAEAYAESEEYLSLKAYLKDVRIKVPDHAKGEAHFNEFRKSHMGTFNLTNDGLEIDVVYQELCEMFPGMFDENITHPADQLLAIADKYESLKPYAYNPHLEYMQDAVDHIVYRFASEVDGIAASPKTKAQKIAEKGAYDKEMALEKERASFERKLDKHKKNSENIINKLQKKIGESEYVRYWEKRLSKEEKTQAVNKVRERQKVAVLKTKIRNIVSNMKKKLDKTEKTGGYPKELVKTVADVCSVIDFHTDRTGKDGGPTKASLKLDALKMQYDALKDNENYDFASEYDEGLSSEIQKLYNKVKDKRVIDLNATELSELKDILSEISQRLSNATKQIGIENARENAAIGSEIIETLNSRSDVIKSGQNQMLREIKLAGQQGKSIVLNPHRINKMIAGYDMNSAWWELYDGINRGSRKASKFVMDATKPFDELTDGGGNEIAFYDFRTKNIKTGIKYLDGSEVEIPKSIICELVMMWDRKQGRTHLETGGAKIPDMTLYNKGKTTVAITDAGKRTAPITQVDIDRLKTKLDSYDKAWIEKAHYLFNNVSKNAINEVSLELIGRELAKEENYIRMYVDQDFIRREIDGKKEDATLESHGSLKETVPNAKQPVVLRGLHENVYDNIDFSSKYYGLAIPIRNFNKVYNIVISEGDGRNSVKELIGQKFGSAIRSNVVEQLIRDLQAPRPRNIEPFGKIRGKWLGATFWGNIRSALKQTTSYWTASSILSESSLAKGVVEYKRHTKQTKAEIGKHSGTLYKRSQGLSTTELGDRANRKLLAGASNKVTKLINEHAPVLRKIPEWIRPGNWLQSMDCAVASALWEACKIEVSKTMDVSDDGYIKAVTDMYERVIEETQSNYDLAHRPEALKNTNAVMRTITMFQTDNLQQSGILFDAYNDYRTKSKLYEKDKSSANEKAKDEAKKGLSKAIRSRVYSSLWLVFVTQLGDMLLRKFKPYIDDEEKEITSSSIAKQSMLMLCDDMLGVLVPVGGQFATKVADTFSEGYDFVTEPTFDVMEDFIKATSKIWDAFAEEDGDVLKAFVDAVPAISSFTGIPAKNISDLYKSIKGYAGDIKSGEFAHDLEDYTSGNKSFYSYGDLASYIASGDKEKETKWKDYYSANGKEFAKGSLTKEIKPAYVQMYVDFPEKANYLKRKLILDYDYTEANIDGWLIDGYLDNVVSDPEYAAEIKGVLSDENKWNTDSVFKATRSYYKKVYKDGNEKETKALRKALLKTDDVSEGTLKQWETEADNEIENAKNKLDAEKEKFKE